MNSLSLVYSVTNDYLPLVGVSLTSVFINNLDIFFNIYIMTTSESTNNKSKLQMLCNNKKCKLIYLSMEECVQYFESAKVKDWKGSYATYCKWFAFDQVKEEICLYLDADVICLNPIVNLPDKVECCAAVLDSCHPIYNKRINFKNDDRYFNAGVYLVNVNIWKKECVTKNILNIINDKDDYLFADQDYWNIALKNKIEVMKPEFNYLAGYDIFGIEDSFDIYELDKKYFYTIDDIKHASNQVVFYHCLGAMTGRPWEKFNRHPIKKQYQLFLMESKLVSNNYIFKSKRKNTIFIIQFILYKILPRNIYKKIHKFQLKKYLMSEKKV